MKNLLNYLNNEDVLTIFEKINTYKNPNWGDRNIGLLKLAIDVSKYTHAETKYDNLMQSIFLENLINLYCNKVDDDTLYNNLENYLQNLPGFNRLEKRQSDTTYEQHGFVSMQIIRYINDLNEEMHEYIIFNPNWIDTEEKREVVAKCFNWSFENSKLDIVSLFDSMKINPPLTNFTFWDFYLKNLDNQNLLEFICEPLGFGIGLPMQKYNSFLSDIKKFIELKDSLIIELNSKNSVNKGQVLKI